MWREGLWRHCRSPSSPLFSPLTSTPAGAAPLPGGSLDPTTIPKYQEPLTIPPAMPRTGVVSSRGEQIDYYEIAVKQFEQYILPKEWSEDNDIDPTTVWSYASMLDPRPAAEGGTLNYPALTIEAQKDRPVRVKWVNGLDRRERRLPAAPLRRRPDAALGESARWRGRDRLSRHGRRAVHGARADRDPRPRGAHHRGQRRLSRGLVPAGCHDIPAGYAVGGTFYEQFKQESEARWARRGARHGRLPVSQRPAPRRRSGTTTTHWA